MQIDILTLFPEIFQPVFEYGVLGRAQKQNLIQIHYHQLRDFAPDKHQKVDEMPYGGGAGMILKFDVLSRAWQAANARDSQKMHTILLSPQGKKFTQKEAKRLQKFERLCFVCGRYEGVDERFVDAHVDEELSLGDFVLSGGEYAAIAMIDSMSRLLPGVLGNKESLEQESFQSGKLEYPQYTRPTKFAGRKVPDVLLSGNHAEIAKWREQQSEVRTQAKRPDLL